MPCAVTRGGLCDAQADSESPMTPSAFRCVVIFSRIQYFRTDQMSPLPDDRSRFGRGCPRNPSKSRQQRPKSSDSRTSPHKSITNIPRFCVPQTRRFELLKRQNGVNEASEASSCCELRPIPSRLLNCLAQRRFKWTSWPTSFLLPYPDASSDRRALM